MTSKSEQASPKSGASASPPCTQSDFSNQYSLFEYFFHLPDDFDCETPSRTYTSVPAAG